MYSIFCFPERSEAELHCKCVISQLRGGYKIYLLFFYQRLNCNKKQKIAKSWGNIYVFLYPILL